MTNAGGNVAGRLSLLAALCVAAILLSCWLGHYPIAWHDLTAIASAEPRTEINIFWDFRAPRVVLGAAAGAGLALGGVVFQALFRNPLAEPFTLGLASGAALGAAIGHLLRNALAIGGLPRPAFFAFFGALAAMGVVYAMSRLRAGFDVTRLLLAGVCVSYASAAGILLAHFLADRTITNAIVKWTVGALDASGWLPGLMIGSALVPIALLSLVLHRHLDLISMGDALAASRGVAVQRTFWIAFATIGLLTAVIVAECGPIGFVGLIVPQIARRIVGHRSAPLMLASLLLGASFLTVCDGLARTPLPRELPVGLFTNILGAGFFFMLLSTERSSR